MNFCERANERRRKSFLLPFFVCLLVIFQCSENEVPQNLPEITTVTPETGSSGMWVKIEGNNFSEFPDKNIVKFNGVEGQVMEVTPAPVTSHAKTRLVVQVPPDAETGPVTVTTDGKTATGPVFTYIVPESTTYFIKFKADGVLLEYEVTDPEFRSCTAACSCFVITKPNGEFAVLKLCGNTYLTPQMILDTKGKTIPIRDNEGFPFGEFSFSANGEQYNSFLVDNLTTSMTIENVVYHSSTLGDNTYNVSGTFEGRVYDKQDDIYESVGITEGSFLVPFSSTRND